ncbi:MAG TPA: hypothetical protein VFA18_05755 [Gemmataceae bacterium]|jgi:hypothetical protein|nr:hypothetical protein [Gemmataceae bacterium]
MERTLRILFRRDPSKDRSDNDVHYEGYRIYWPNGRPVAVGLDAFCKHGQRLFGLGRHLAGCRERLIDLIYFPLTGRDDDLNRVPGFRVRRFYLERRGRQGRVHFLDGTPTTIVFEIGRDEPRALHWIGLIGLRDGEQQWFDLAAKTVEPAAHVASPVQVRFGSPTVSSSP